jgi:hypothetical protein
VDEDRSEEDDRRVEIEDGGHARFEQQEDDEEARARSGQPRESCADRCEQTILRSDGAD